MGTVLQVEVEELTDAEGMTARRDKRVYESAAEIERAMMAYEVTMR
jgi:hypothetical protein